MFEYCQCVYDASRRKYVKNIIIILRDLILVFGIVIIYTTAQSSKDTAPHPVQKKKPASATKTRSV